MISANGRLVAISLSSSITKYTDDGITWHSSSAYDSYARWTNSIYNANGLWVIATSIGLYYSSDATTGTKSNITSGEFRSVYNANGIWVAGTSSGLYYSPTWEVSTAPRSVSEEWVLKSSVTASPLTIPGESGFLTLPLEADFSSGLTAYDKFVLVEDSSSSLSLGDHFTI